MGCFIDHRTPAVRGAPDPSPPHLPRIQERVGDEAGPGGTLAATPAKDAV